MFLLGGARAVMGVLLLAQRPVAWLDSVLAVKAGEVEGKQRKKVGFEVFVTEEEFEAVIAHPEVRQAWERAAVVG